MKKVLLLAFILSLTFSAVQAQVTVTFLANTAGVPDTLGPGSTVQIRGEDNIADDSPDNVLAWSAATTVNLTNIGGDYWLATVTFPAEALQNVIYFKFYTNVHESVAPGDDWEHQGWEADVSGGNRVLDLTTFAGTDTTLPLQYVNGFKAGMDQYESLFPTSDSIDVWVRVNMHAKIQVQQFDPATQSVGVRGSNTSDWGQTGDLSWGSTVFLSPEGQHPNGGSQQYDGSYFYSGRIRIPVEWIGTSIAHKFVIHNNTDLDNPAEWAADPNWEFVCPAQDTTIHWRYWNDIPPSSEAPVSGNVLFNVDMTTATQVGIFDRALGDTVFVHGSFNGWGHNDYTKSLLERIPGTEIYEMVLPHTDKAGATMLFKYFIDFQDLTKFYDMQDWWGWEEPATWGGGNRIIEFEGVPDQLLPIQYFDDIPPEGIIPDGDTVTVTMNIDMTPALSEPVPFNPSTDTLRLALHPPIWVALLGRTEGVQSDLIFEDPDEDMVYTLTWDIVGPASYALLYATQYTGGSEEGGGFDFGRRRTRYIQPLAPNQFPRYYTFPTDTFQADPPLLVEEPPFKTGVVTRKNAPIQKTYVLNQNYPNPFNPETTIEYSLPNMQKAQRVTMRVYNVRGQYVATLVDHLQNAGNYVARWDGKDRFGNIVPSGVYLYQLRVGDVVKSRKMLLMK